MKHIMIWSMLCICLTACTSYFGMTKEEWESLTPNQQNQVIKAYNEREAERQRAESERELIAEQNAPINNLVQALGSAIPHKENKRSKTTTTEHCNADGSSCTTKSKTKSFGWSMG